MLKFFFLFLFMLYTSNICYAGYDLKQGSYLDATLINELKIGMSKQDVISKIGYPNLLVSNNANVFCYLFFKIPCSCSLPIINNYLIIIFNNSFLKSYFFRT